MVLQITVGSALLLTNILVAAVAAMLLEVMFQRGHAWMLREPHRPKLVAMIAGVSLWVLGVITAGVWLWAFAYLWIGAFGTLEEAVYFSLVCFTTLGFGVVFRAIRGAFHCAFGFRIKSDLTFQARFVVSRQICRGPRSVVHGFVY